MRLLSALATASSLALLTGCMSVPAGYDPLCGAIAAFANSTRGSPSRAVTLTTDWGGRFSPQSPDRYTLASKTCDHSDYQPGSELCSFLLQNTSTEFPDANLNSVLVCLGVARPTEMVTDVETLRVELWSYVAHDVHPDIRVGVDYFGGSKTAPPSLKISAEEIP